MPIRRVSGVHSKPINERVENFYMCCPVERKHRGLCRKPPTTLSPDSVAYWEQCHTPAIRSTSRYPSAKPSGC
jgi:hypothetical protein